MLRILPLPFIALILCSCATTPRFTPHPAYPAADRYEGAIRHFEAREAENPPPKGTTVFVGSSSMAGWHGTLHGDFAPLEVIPRGFGGSNYLDALHFVDALVLRHRPRAVVVYEGDNDVARGAPPEAVAATAGEFVDRIHAELPDCRIHILSIKPSPARWNLWPKMRRANRLLADLCAGDDRLVYVDVATPMLDDRDQPRPELYKRDRLHMTREGYLLWRDVLRPVLLD